MNWYARDPVYDPDPHMPVGDFGRALGQYHRGCDADKARDRHLARRPHTPGKRARRMEKRQRTSVRRQVAAWLDTESRSVPFLERWVRS